MDFEPWNSSLREHKPRKAKRVISFLIDDILNDTYAVEEIYPAYRTVYQFPNRPARTTVDDESSCSPPSPCETDSSCERDSLSPPSSPAKLTKKNRPTFSPYKVMQLKMVFARQQYLEPKQRRQLAMELDMTEGQVKCWFQNKRTKLKKKLVQATERNAKVAYLTSLASKLTGSTEPQYPNPLGPTEYPTAPTRMLPEGEFYQRQTGVADSSLRRSARDMPCYVQKPNVTTSPRFPPSGLPTRGSPSFDDNDFFYY